MRPYNFIDQESSLKQLPEIWLVREVPGAVSDPVIFIFDFDFNYVLILGRVIYHT